MAADKVEAGTAGAGAEATAAAPVSTAKVAEVTSTAAAGDHPAAMKTTATASTATATATGKNADPAGADGADGAEAGAVDEDGGAEGQEGKGEGEKGEEGEQEMAVFIIVYPPQTTPPTPPLVLEPLAGIELVMQVRQLLGETPQTCLYSAFRLVAVTPKEANMPEGDKGDVEDKEDEEVKEVKEDGDVWKREGNVMNDFVELRSIPAVAARPDKVEVRMELEPYTVNSARQHVQKFRDLLRYPPPCPDGVGPGVKKGAGSGGKKGKGKAGGGGKNKKSTSGAPAPAPGANVAVKTATASQAAGAPPTDADADAAAEAAAQRIHRALDLRARLKDSRVPVAGPEGLGLFYGVGLGLAVEEVASPSPEEGSLKNKDRDTDGPVACLKGLSVSAWNPPPPQRRMVGDLMYLEVVALDGTAIHVTCTQGGFYVNGTTRGSFDPNPISGNACHSHELAVCLLARNPSFAKAWNNAVTQAWKRIQSDDPVHALARAMREGRGDSVMVKPQWNMPIPDPKWAEHKADPSRAQDDLSSGFGMEDRGVPREWNDEYQCLLELPNDSADLSMTRSRALHKLLCDFQDAATAGAVAIGDGFIPPANPTEAEHSHVFVFNNIFFSYAADSPDAYKAVSGESAARKAASQDLASVVALNTLGEAFHPTLSIKTLATAVVDFSGRRIIAQSLVPGILNGDQTNKVVYGAMEHGQPLRENDKVSSLLKEVGQRLMIAEREIDAIPIKRAPSSSSSSSSLSPSVLQVHRIVEAVAEESHEESKAGSAAAATTTDTTTDSTIPATIKITGAVEMKGIVGSDGRSYLLDVSRITPRDANWVRGPKGTGVYDEWMATQADLPALAVGDWEREGVRAGSETSTLDASDLSFESMAVLRPELLTMFTRHKVGEWFRARNLELGKNADTASGEKQPGDAGESAPLPLPPPPTPDNTSLTEKETVGTIEAMETIPAPSALAEAMAEEKAAGDNGADVASEESVAAAGKAGVGKQGEGVSGSGELEKGVDGGAVVPHEVEGGVVAEGEEEEERVMKALRMSEEELTRLKEEQEARYNELAMNVNVFMPYEGCIDQEQLLADEALAREAATHLWDVALPFVTAEVKRGSLCPLDCAELATVLHAAGVNLRYLGRLATVAVAEEAEDAAVREEGKLRRWRMPLFWLEMLETEMVARAATHVFNRYMANSSARARHAPGKAIHHFLNCLIGGTENPTTSTTSRTSKGKGNSNTSAIANGSFSISPYSPSTSPLTSPTGGVPADSSWIPEGDFDLLGLTPVGLWQSLCAEVFMRFRHRLVLWGAPSNTENAQRRHKLPLLRRVCQRLGVRVLSKAYGLDTTEPFALEDISGVVPVVKSCVPASPAPEAAEALEMAQLHLTSGSGLQTAHDFAQHAATLLLQACDGMHSKYPTALNLQARVMYLGGDPDTAVALQLKALAYFEQLEGLDSAAVVKCHEQLGQYYMTAGLYDKALAHMRAFCYLIELTAGPNHPELSNAYHRMGRAYQDLGSAIMALRCYQEALERQPGDHMINPRVHHSVAETLEAMGGYTDALKHERLSHAGFKAVHGNQHPLVTTSTQNIRALTTKVVKVAQGNNNSSQQTSLLAAAKAASASATAAAAAAGGSGQGASPPASQKKTAARKGEKGGGTSGSNGPAAEPVVVVSGGSDGGVEESKGSEPQEGEGAGNTNGGKSSSALKTKISEDGR